jgi:hypothetical protein
MTSIPLNFGQKIAYSLIVPLDLPEMYGVRTLINAAHRLEAAEIAALLPDGCLLVSAVGLNVVGKFAVAAEITPLPVYPRAGETFHFLSGEEGWAQEFVSVAQPDGTTRLESPQSGYRKMVRHTRDSLEIRLVPEPRDTCSSAATPKAA